MAAIESVTAEIWDSKPMINVIVRVVDADGLEGIGETWWGILDKEVPARGGRPMASIVNDVLAPRVIGRDAEDVEEIWHDLANWGQRYGDQGVFLMGLSGLDIALWDLRGKRAGRPVCELLGGPVHDALPAYASLPWLWEADLVMRETRRAVDAGFGAVKLHEVDPEFTAMLRGEFGDDVILMVDVNGAFTIDEAIEHGVVERLLPREVVQDRGPGSTTSRSRSAWPGPMEAAPRELRLGLRENRRAGALSLGRTDGRGGGHAWILTQFFSGD